jgi:tetratricopeptide (TPR) repeat protein
MAARVYAWLGDDAEAARLEQGVGEPEMGKVAAVRAEQASRVGAPSERIAEAFDAQMTALDAWLATRHFDLVRNAVDIAIEYHPGVLGGGGVSGDAARRARVEGIVLSANEQLAYDLRIANLLRLAANCEKAGDRSAARAFIARADETLGVGKWLSDDGAVQLALIAQAKARSGDGEGCATQLEAAVARFDAGRADILDIDRARPLRAIAEAYAAAGETSKARAMYARAVEEGAVNPNARPRAEDLVATILSMVAAEVEPGAELAARMAAVREGLVAPW